MHSQIGRPDGGRMLMRLRQQWKLFPVTWSVVVASTALFIATRVTWLQQAYPRLWADAVLAGSDWFGWWKDLAPLAEFVRSTVPEADIIAIMEDAGALGLEAFWQGDAWRLLVSGFHHGFFLHIAGNLLVLAALGQLMEPRCRRRWWYLAFCLSSTLVTVLAEALLGQAAIGLSGTGYAMFGYLSIVRMRDQKLREILPLGLVIVGVVSMLVCIPITHFGWLPIANTAHFVGLGYGMLAGAVATAPRPILAGSGFLAAHLALIPLTQMAMEPTWTDFYIECQAYHEEDPADKARLLTELLRRDPTRDDVRLRLVWALVTGKQQDVAWRVAVAGWHDKPDSDQKALVALLQHLWFRLDAPIANGMKR